MNEKFAELGSPRRIWAVAAMHGDVDRLATLHDDLAGRFNVRDRLVYLGNYLGAESASGADMFDEILAFRSALLSKPGIEPSDITYLRGPAEEAWLRLLRLQFAPDVPQTLERLFASGVEGYLRMYGISISETRTMARAGSMTITRWTNQLRAAQRQMAGHETIFSCMRRAAFGSRQSDQKSTLFVPAGFDCTRSLEDQAEALWWTTSTFRLTGRSASSYNRIIRGFNSVNEGSVLDEAAVTLDGGCGRGGPLLAGCFTPSGHLVEVIAVGTDGSLESAPFEREIANDFFAAEPRVKLAVTNPSPAKPADSTVRLQASA